MPSLCMTFCAFSNSYADSDRYLVFGVANDGQIPGVEDDANTKDQR